MIAIKVHVQAEKKYCGYCHFLDSREGCLHPDPSKERYWCEAFTQEIESDKQDRPQRIEDCLNSEGKS